MTVPDLGPLIRVDTGEPDTLTGAELRSLLRKAERSATWLAGKVGLSRTQVVRWQVGGVPEKHRARVRQLLPPAPKL